MYIGFKAILATAMTRQEYNDYRGWVLPADEAHLANDEGYLVEYLDGGVANHPKHKGYISWSPKAVFDQAYKANGQLGFAEVWQYLMLNPEVRIARSGWNGANLHVTMWKHPEHSPMNDHPAIFNAKIQQYHSWVPSSADLCANDWLVISPVEEV